MTVCPGYVSTNFSANAVKGSNRQRMGGAGRRGIPPTRVANAVLRGYLERKREIVVPWRDRLTIKLYQNSPKLVEWIMARMLKPVEQASPR